MSSFALLMTTGCPGTSLYGPSWVVVTALIFSTVAIPSTTIRYNSRIPLVVYVPKGGEVRYRIWKAAEKIDEAKQG